MSKIFSVNAGSSSLKFQINEMPEERLIVEGLIERIGLGDSIVTFKFDDKKEVIETNIENHSKAVEILLDKVVEFGIVSSLDEINGVGHRVVHGGEKFVKSVIIDSEVEKGIEECSSLAPLHNPANLVGIRAFKQALPSIVQVAVFDTAFHQTMPRESYIYPIPMSYYEKYGIRRYGFHGTSHKYVSEKTLELLGNPEYSRIIVCHLGNGASLSAIKNGKSINTSMGMTPLAGIMMGTRSGDIDPAIIEYIKSVENVSAEDVINTLNKKSGMLGVSGVSSDSRDVENAAKAGNEDAIFTEKLYIRRICDYIGQYIIQLGGLDALVFTAGIGENSIGVRAEIIKEVGRSTGMKINPDANNSRGELKLISADDSTIKAFVVPTNEEIEIARNVLELM